jgi:hypothetical protein
MRIYGRDLKKHLAINWCLQVEDHERMKLIQLGPGRVNIGSCRIMPVARSSLCVQKYLISHQHNIIVLGARTATNGDMAYGIWHCISCHYYCTLHDSGRLRNRPKFVACVNFLFRQPPGFSSPVQPLQLLHPMMISSPRDFFHASNLFLDLTHLLFSSLLFSRVLDLVARFLQPHRLLPPIVTLPRRHYCAQARPAW